MSISNYANRETSAHNGGGNPVPNLFVKIRRLNDYRKQIINVNSLNRDYGRNTRSE